MTGYDRRGAAGIPAELLARLSLALRAALTGERPESALLPLTREFCREARESGVPPEGVVTAFKQALGALPPHALEGRFQRIREQLITHCIAAYYAPAAEAAPRAGAVPEAQRHYAAVVDDDPVMLALLRYILEPAFEVDTFDDARHALASFYRRRPDLVVLDVHLPDYSGQTLLGVLRGDPRLRGVPAIAVTGDDTPSLQDRLRADGFAATFPKPLLAPDEILRTATALADAAWPGAKGAAQER